MVETMLTYFNILAIFQLMYFVGKFLFKFCNYSGKYSNILKIITVTHLYISN